MNKLILVCIVTFARALLLHEINWRPCTAGLKTVERT